MDPIRDSAGEITHWIAIQRDVTERKALERVAREQQDELQRTVILRSLAKITEDAIHDSLQPLYAVGNLAAACRNAILNRGLETESEKILEWLQSILEGVNNSKLSVTKLRSFATGSEPRREMLALDDVIVPALDMLARDFECGGVSLHTQLECRSTIEADSAQIRYVLANLVRNASEAIQSSAAKTGHIKLRSWSRDGLCHLTVEDDGPGFECEALADIFSPFYSTKTDMLGLGLAYSKTIVNAHGGDIYAERVKSGGLRVGFTIPVVQVPHRD
jgi:C4-dicarboxylate-specific signal transduction histidine kinase